MAITEVTGGKQLGLSDYKQCTTKKRTKNDKFLAEMDQAMPWHPLLDVIEPVYPKVSSKGGHVTRGTFCG